MKKILPVVAILASLTLLTSIHFLHRTHFTQTAVINLEDYHQNSSLAKNEEKLNVIGRYAHRVSKKLDQYCGDWQERYVLVHESILSRAFPPKFLIYDCSTVHCGGQGDRLRGLTSLFYLGILMERAVIIRWYKPRRFIEVFEPNEVDWDGSIPFGLDIRTWDWIDKKNLDLEAEMEKISQIDIAVFSTNRYLLKDIFDNPKINAMAESRGLYPNITCPIGCISSFAWKQSPRMLEYMSNMRNEVFGEDRQNLNVIGMHVRLGGQWNDPLRMTIDTAMNIIKCAEKMEIELGLVNSTKRTVWYLATDNDELKRRAVEAAPNKIVTAKTIEIIHVDKPHKVVSSESYMGVFAEQLLLSESDCLMLTNSGYGYAARDMGFVKCMYRFSEEAECKIVL